MYLPLIGQLVQRSDVLQKQATGASLRLGPRGEGRRPGRSLTLVGPATLALLFVASCRLSGPKGTPCLPTLRAAEQPHAVGPWSLASYRQRQ